MFEDTLTREMRVALHDFVKATTVCNWCADHCLGPEMEECASVSGVQSTRRGRRSTLSNNPLARTHRVRLSSTESHVQTGFPVAAESGRRPVPAVPTPVDRVRATTGRTARTAVDCPRRPRRLVPRERGRLHPRQRLHPAVRRLGGVESGRTGGTGGVIERRNR